jgi:hypothetical protein
VGGAHLRSSQKDQHAIRAALQRTNTKNSNQISPEKKLRGHSPNFHIHVSVWAFYIFDLPILLQEIIGPILGIHKLLKDKLLLKLELRRAILRKGINK